MTDCTMLPLAFQDLGSRKVLADFNGGYITSDAGALLLRELDSHFGFLDRFALCFTDHRDPERIEHTLVELLKQRVFALCLGYEDLNDHDQLRHDPLLAVLVGKTDPEGQNRHRPADKGIPLAGKSTLNRLELSAIGAKQDTRYKKIVAHMDRLQEYLVDVFLLQHTTAPERLVLDLDATDDSLHGQQLGRFFHGYYKDYCYLPLYIFCDDHPLAAVLRPSDIDASAGCLPHVQRIVQRIRQVWPDVPIVLRGDSGFCRDYLMRWCEANAVDYVFGLAKNKRLVHILGAELHQAKQLYEQTGQPARVFKDFTYRTRKSWRAQRRVIGKAEHLRKGTNPRFVVTSLSAEAFPAQPLYEQEYCGRGDMENRIKEQQLYLFADHLCCETMRANQVRLYLSTVAYVVLRAFRQFGLAGTPLQSAQPQTMRQRMFRIGALVTVSVRRVVVAMSSSYPWGELFGQMWENLQRLLASGPPSLPDVVGTG